MKKIFLGTMKINGESMVNGKMITTKNREWLGF